MSCGRCRTESKSLKQKAIEVRAGGRVFVFGDRHVVEYARFEVQHVHTLQRLGGRHTKRGKYVFAHVPSIASLKGYLYIVPLASRSNDPK